MATSKSKKASESRWVWFFLTIGASFAPIIIRVFYHFVGSLTEGFDVKDLLYGTIAINVANFNLMIKIRHEARKILCIVFTCIFIAGSSMILGQLLQPELLDADKFWIILGLLILVVLASIYLSYVINFIR